MTYDSNGNATAVSGGAYGYDAANRLTSASAGAGSTAFTFDPLSRLATSTVGGASTRRQYVGEQLAAEYNVGTGALTRRYIPGLGLDDVAAAYDGSGTSNRSWQLADERGSVIAQSGATGAVSNINTYDEYGVPASGNVGRFQYTGQQWLPEAGAYHYRARTYLPEVGQFLQTDPIGYRAGANLYAYVSGDPINFVDPSGTQQNFCVDTWLLWTDTYWSDGSVTRDNERTVLRPSTVACPSISDLFSTNAFTGGAGQSTGGSCSIGSVNIERRGHRIRIRGTVSFPNGESRYLDAINDSWTGMFGRYDVTTDLTVGSGGLIANIANGPGGRPTGDLGGPNMYLNTLTGATPSQLNYSIWTAGHEFGHNLTLPDQYTASGPNPGYENEIMGAVGGTVRQDTIDDVLKSCKP